MRFGKQFALLASLVVAGTSAHAEYWRFESKVTAYDPPSANDQKFHNSLAAWDATGRQAITSASSLGHPFEPPASGSWAEASFDQSHVENAVYRGLALSRVGYRVNEHNDFTAESNTALSYDLQIENQSAQNLNIVFGNQFHGVMATVENGIVYGRELTRISGIGDFDNSITCDSSGYTATGMWTNAVTNTLYNDPYFGVRDAFELHAFEFYGTVGFAPGQVTTMSVDHSFLLQTNFRYGGDGNGLALADFTNTGRLTVKAYDPITGEDLSRLIQVKLVPEPFSALVLGTGLLTILRRRKQQKS